jgi:hypothetical protein
MRSTNYELCIVNYELHVSLHTFRTHNQCLTCPVEHFEYKWGKGHCMWVFVCFSIVRVFFVYR